MKKNSINWYGMGLDENNKDFWMHFIADNLMPPMTFKEMNDNVEFKSFNTNYMVWLLAHKGSVDLYNYYIQEQHDDLMKTFITKYNLKNQEELHQLNIYLNNIAMIFYQVKEGSDEKNEVKSWDEEEEIKPIKKGTNNFKIEQKINSISIIPSSNNIITNDIFSADNYCDQKVEWNPQYDNEYSKMFNNSFDYDKDYMFHEE